MPAIRNFKCLNNYISDKINFVHGLSNRNQFSSFGFFFFVNLFAVQLVGNNTKRDRFLMGFDLYFCRLYFWGKV